MIQSTTARQATTAPLPQTVQIAIGFALGAAGWPLLALLLPFVPLPIRFLTTWFVFTAGPGMIAAAVLTRPFDPLRRVIVTLAVGTAVTPLVISLLGYAHLIPLFPYVAGGCLGAGLACWRQFDRGNGRPPMARGDAVACAALVTLALTLGAVVFWHRLDTSGGAVVLYGDYDTADMGYYAAEAAEASHTVPPTASYYSGHKLNAAYYPHLVLGMVNRFADVPVLPMYYRFAWPTFLMLSSLAGFVLVSALASRRVAVLAMVLLLIGGDFSYLAAWFLEHADLNWDFVLWPTNFLSPTMELLHFSTWGLAMPLFLTMLFAAVRGLQTRSRAWLILSGFLLGVLFEFKPFAFVVVMGALGAATLFSGRDWAARWSYVTIAVSGVVFGLPSIYAAATIEESDRRSRLLFDVLLLPRRMLIKLDLTGAFTDFAARWAPHPSLQRPLLLAAATALFLAVGVGVRWIGVGGVWRAIRASRGPDVWAWRLLAWTVVAGIAIPSVIATEPYNDTLQFHVTGLYVLWIFTAVALSRLIDKQPAAGRLALAAVFILALPSSLHFLTRKWADQTREPRVAMTREERTVAEYLRNFDPETTVVLHDRPLAPSLTTIVAARRVVLGWDVSYSAVGGEARLADVNAFYGSVDGDANAAMAILRRYAVTHVIVRADDRVHPDVIQQLRPLLRLKDVSLYAVPSAAGG